MRLGTITAGLLLWQAAPAASQALQPTRADIATAADDSFSDASDMEQIAVWRRDLRTLLRHGKPDAAADRIAVEAGAPRNDMRRLLRLWIVATARANGNDRGWMPAVRDEAAMLTPALRDRPRALAMLADTLNATRACAGEDFATLLAGSPDAAADGYLVAQATRCTANFARAAIAAGDRAMPVLIRLAEWGSLPTRDQLPLHAWLTSPAALAHVADANRDAVAARLWRRYLRALAAAGMEARALALSDALAPGLRAAAVSALPLPALVARIDGIAVRFEAERGPQKGTSPDAPTLSLAEAMALAGRADEARLLLATLPDLAAARATLACHHARAPAGSADCADPGTLPMAALFLDHLLDHPADDPYPLAEALLSDGLPSGADSGDAVLCRLFPEPDFAGICRAGSLPGEWSDGSDDAAELEISEAALVQVVPGWDRLRADFPAPPAADAASAQARRATVAAVAPDYGERPIPDEFRGPARAGPLGLATPLPPGFLPIRVERSGRRVVAISASQAFDPTGEVSQGGYWVHLSGDGGKTWEPPLYTGLADRFPYVVRPQSRLPLLAGEALHLAVDVAEIDTASIIYPPVALQARRRAADRYLTIPLAELRRDSDGDGLTDVAANHLLLGRDDSGRDRPFILGSDGKGQCSAPPTRERLALADILSTMTGASAAAIVEPLDRPQGPAIGGWSKAAGSGSPLFVTGRREDFACLSSQRPVIVYSAEQIARLQRFTPDFHAMEMPRIVFNRARDRGYVRWSMGWTGGTLRLRWVGGKWQIDTISSWIT